MKFTHRSGFAGLLAALTLGLLAFTASGLAPTHERMPPRLQRSLIEDPSNARVIVKFRSDSSMRKALSGGSGKPVLMVPQHASVLAARLNMHLTDGRVLGPHTQVIKGQGLSSSQLAARLAGMSDVQWAVVDGRRYARSVPNDPYFGGDLSSVTPAAGQWYLRAPNELFKSAINALGAWNLSTGSSAVTVAVLDTGVILDHPDLVGKLHPGYDFVSDELYSADGTPRDPDASDPGDASYPGDCGNAQFEPSSWHGTQVAGIVGAATNNGLGVAGVGRDVMVLPIRVLGKCGGTDSDIIAGMRWAAGLTSDVGGSAPVINDHPAKVLNLSLGSSGRCMEAYQDLMQELTIAGVSVVVAAGNEAGLKVSSPANCPGVVAVAGLRHLGTKVGFSSIGPEVSISAPGGNCVNSSGACLYPIMSTSNSGQTGPTRNIYTDGDLHYGVGTSFSAPQVSGTIGLMLSLNPNLTPAEIRDALRATARPFPASGSTSDVSQCHAPTSAEQVECYCTTSTCGAGMLDAAAAVAWVNPHPTARISVDTVTLSASHSIVVSASASSAPGQRMLSSYQWTMLSGQQYGAFIGSTTSDSATVHFAQLGTVEVQLQVTDSTGASSTSTQTLSGGPPPVTPSRSGGSAGAGWVAGLLFACWLLWRHRRATRTPGL